VFRLGLRLPWDLLFEVKSRTCRACGDCCVSCVLFDIVKRGPIRFILFPLGGILSDVHRVVFG
jgi:hypothetical protein